MIPTTMPTIAPVSRLPAPEAPAAPELSTELGPEAGVCSPEALDDVGGTWPVSAPLNNESTPL